MALGRVKTWISEILTAADLNAEFNNILNNATSLISPATAAWDMDGKELILDADADTSITADTDDQVDVKIGGTDKLKMIATGITAMGVDFVEAEGAAVASAGTTNIWAGDGNTLHITGTTTITSFGTAPQAGAWKKIIFDGALTLTHAANLSLPGSANITTAADDMAFVYADTTTQFDVIYFRKSGAAVNGGMVLLQTVTASASATVDLETGIGSTYDDYVIIGDGVDMASSVPLNVRFKIGGAYLTAGYTYHTDVSLSSAATYAGINSASAGAIIMSADINSSVSDSNFSFRMDVFNANSGTLGLNTAWAGSSFDSNTNVSAKANGQGSNVTAGAITGVRFLGTSGNITAGTFRLYGVIK